MSHISSHVKVKSVRCIECCLSFPSKDALMSHLHSCHTSLPKGICIDVSIDNHERLHLQHKNDVISAKETFLSSEVPCTGNQWDSSEETRDIASENVQENCARATYKPAVNGTDSMKAKSDRSNDIDVESSSSTSSQEYITTPASQTDDTVESFSATKTCGRKLSETSHVVVTDTECSEIVGANDYNWVEIVAATQPMVTRCVHCSFTCNTELQLKV